MAFVPFYIDRYSKDRTGNDWEKMGTGNESNKTHICI